MDGKVHLVDDSEEEAETTLAPPSKVDNIKG